MGPESSYPPIDVPKSDLVGVEYLSDGTETVTELPDDDGYDFEDYDDYPELW